MSEETVEPDAGGDARTLPSAPPSRRLVAFLVDLAPVIAFHLSFASWVASALFFVAYHTVSLATSGRTVGKAAMAIRVQRVDGQHPGWTSALLRSSLGYLASSFFLLGFLHMLADRRQRAWHDLLFACEVVQDAGALSFKLLVKRVDQWSEQLDDWQGRRLAGVRRLRGLLQHAIDATKLLESFTSILERLVVSLGVPAGTKVSAVIASTITSAALGTASVASYNVLAPTILRSSVAESNTDFPGVVARVTRFDRSRGTLTLVVAFENVGSTTASFCLSPSQSYLIDETTRKKLNPSFSEGRISCRFGGRDLDPGQTHVIWTKYAVEEPISPTFTAVVPGVPRPIEGLPPEQK